MASNFNNYNNPHFLREFSKHGSHKFHLVDPSPWPLLTSFCAGTVAIAFSLYMHQVLENDFLAFLSFFLLVSSMACWWRDVIREATAEGHHTKVVVKGLKLGMLLFIVSEVLFFFAFFWAIFALQAKQGGIFLGYYWPPVGLDAIDPLGLPTLNTFILLTSGVTVTWAHSAILNGFAREAKVALLLTIILAAKFTFFQLIEYIDNRDALLNGLPENVFDITSSAYGSCFYMSTGFHGFHVFVGTCFLFVCFIRLIKGHFTTTHHVGFEAAAWYWHFVDVVWILLYFALYWVGCLPTYA